MTTRHVENASTALPNWRIQRTPDTDVRLTHAGRVALPLSLFQDTDHRADVSLVMTAEEAESLHSELGCLLYPQVEGEAS
ncbi:hypothetical protein [Streptomyces sp. NPDC020681]|uniref:hypothetical protein n=1 Tax=Streptomyces sp. NPDC020681 TaxID=3365083 RepID=UPI0037B6EE4D